MGECAMEIRKRRVAGFMQVAQDMGLGLREIGRVPLDVKANPVRGAVDAEDEFETHSNQGYVKSLDSR